MSPPGWTEDDPCPGCGSWDITEWETGRQPVIRMAWECRDCGYLARWIPARTWRREVMPL